MSLPTLSVVVPNYNDSAYLGTTLEAICQQSLKPIEVLVIDNCSTDNSMDIIKEIAVKYSFVQPMQNERNFGPLFSVNRGIKLTKGDYIFISSANDLIYPGFFEKSMMLLARYPEAGLSCTDFDVNYIAENKVVHSKWIPDSGYFSPRQLAEIARQSMTTFSAGPNSIIKKALLPDGDPYIVETGGLSDWFLSKVIAYRYGCCYIPEALIALTWDDKSYWNKAAEAKKRFQLACTKVFQLFASCEYEDIAPLIIRSRGLRNIELSMRSPVAVYKAIYQMDKRNNYANHLFIHLVGEYFCSIVDPFWQKCRPICQFVYDSLVSGAYLVKNVFDRAYGRAFHEYDRLKSALKKRR